MGMGYSTRINGQCVNSGNNSGVEFLRTVSFNIAFSSMNCTSGVDGNFLACGSSPLFVPPVAGTEPYPQNYIPPSGTMPFAPVYGLSDGTVAKQLTRLNGDPVWFTAADVAPWQGKFYCPPPYAVGKVYGPSFKSCTCYGSMEKKDPTTGNYQQRESYNFVDGFEVPDPDRMVKTCGQVCTTRNWLTMSGTGNDAVVPIFSSVNQPFLIDTHYENCGETAPSNPNFGGDRFIPFCAPINCRLEDGTIIGQYTGICFSAVFGMANLAYGFANPYLPSDPFSPVPPPKPPVDSHRFFCSLELSTYFTGITTNAQYPLGSPLLTKVRYWLYSSVSITPWRYPLKIMFSSSIYLTNPFLIRMNVIGDPNPLDLKMNLTNQKVYVSY